MRVEVSTPRDNVRLPLQWGALEVLGLLLMVSLIVSVVAVIVLDIIL